ncbi:MAG: Snf7 family protein, partial [Candidatus Helarchaeota archaeon]
MASKFINWLKGNNLKNLIFKIDVFCRKLDYQRKTLEKESLQNRARARKYREQGNDAAAKLYAENTVRFQKWALGVDTYRLHIMGLLMKLKQTQATAETAKILSGIHRALNGLRSSVNIQNVTQIIDQIDSQIEGFDIAQDMAQDGIQNITVKTEVSPQETNKVLAEID